MQEAFSRHSFVQCGKVEQGISSLTVQYTATRKPNG